VLDQFESMVRFYLSNESGKIDFKKIQQLQAQDLVPYALLEDDLEAIGESQLSTTSVIKLNGGLGTTMGLNSPKSLVPVRGNDTFLDITVKQLQAFNKKYDTQIPFYLMDSERTLKLTLDHIQDKYDVQHFSQHMFPRLNKATGQPLELEPGKKELEWCPPGHGDIFLSLECSGTLDDLLSKGVCYAFISNGDNLGATLDLKILGYIAKHNMDFVIETTPKTKADVKGGTLIRYNDALTLLERAQVEAHNLSEFEDVVKFQVFNTNNIWVDLRALKQKLIEKRLDLPVIVNEKVVEGIDCIQLETAMGAAVSVFDSSVSVIVDRSRFMPVKKTSDLLVMRSDAVESDNQGGITISSKRNPALLPLVNLSKEYESLEVFDDLVKVVPSLLECQSLTISGPIRFNEHVTIKGDVVLTNNESTEAEMLQKAIVNETVEAK
jgi:UTP--glucose-1-phosphate uridylyltransferase